MTAELFTDEIVLSAMLHHRGQGNGINARDLADEIGGLFRVQGDERALRAAIEQLRLKGHPICGHPSTGYFHAETEDELIRTCNFLYERAKTSLAQIAAMRKVSLPDLRGQLRLPELRHPLKP